MRFPTVENLFRSATLLILSLIYSSESAAQVCADPAKYIYGLSATGIIYPINVTNAGVGTALNTPYGSPSSPNAMGYHGANGKFYYFNNNYPDPVFVSYEPVSNSYAVLAAPEITNSVVTGCINHDGTGFYCLDINANLFYYNIAGNTWVKITSTFMNQNGANITNTMKSLPSGDMAIDGNGNLWFVISNYAKFGLYELVAPLPTTPVNHVVLSQVISPQTSTPEGNAIAGIAFNATGQIYLSTVGNKLFIVNNDHTVSLKGSLNRSGAGTDLTSCNYPATVLSSAFSNLSHLVKNTELILNWTISLQQDKNTFYIEKSTDGISWTTIDSMVDINNSPKYAYRSAIENTGIHYYRVYLLLPDRSKILSPVEKIANHRSGNTIALWPNPADQVIYVRNNDTERRKMRLYNNLGLVLLEKILDPGTNKIEVAFLPRGTYHVAYLHGDKITNLKFIRN